jgi:hypothetical protein
MRRRRLSPLGAAFIAWDVWRRLPPKQRKWVLAQAREHGPRLAKQALDAQKKRKRKR